MHLKDMHCTGLPCFARPLVSTCGFVRLCPLRTFCDGLSFVFPCVQAYRLCYSFSAKSTLFNLIADSWKSDGDLQLAGWFFVGEGTGSQYAADLQESMYNQFRLALCKAIACNEKFLDENAYQRASAACTQMTGIVVLRNVERAASGSAGKDTSLRFELHEFAVPWTKQKLLQEIKSKFKAYGETMDLEEFPSVPNSSVPSLSVCEVVDLISDDDEQDDDIPLIDYPAVQSGPPQHSTPGHDKETLLPCETASNTHENECGQSSVKTALASVHIVCDSDGNENVERLQTICDIVGEQAFARWRVQSAYERWAKEKAANEADPRRARDLFCVLDLQRKALYKQVRDSLATTPPLVVHNAEASISSSTESCNAAVAVQPVPICAQPVACCKANVTTHVSQVPVASFAKLRVGVRAHASLDSNSEHGIVPEQVEARHSSTRPGTATTEQQNVTQEGSSSLYTAPENCQLARHLKEYDEACNSHRGLFRKMHAKMQQYTNQQPADEEIEENCKHLIQNSVLVTILRLALHRTGSEAVHGILAGVVRGGHILISRALAADEAPPSCSEGADGVDCFEKDALWLRKQAEMLLPEARLLPKTTFPDIYKDVIVVKEDDAGSETVEKRELGGPEMAAMREVMCDTEKTMIGDTEIGKKVEAEGSELQLCMHKGVWETGAVMLERGVKGASENSGHEAMQVVEEQGGGGSAAHQSQQKYEEQLLLKQEKSGVQGEGSAKKEAGSGVLVEQEMMLERMGDCSQDSEKGQERTEVGRCGLKEEKGKEEIGKDELKLELPLKHIEERRRDDEKEQTGKQIVKQEEGQELQPPEGVAHVGANMEGLAVDGDTETGVKSTAGGTEGEASDELVVLGYFRVAASAGAEMGEQDRRLLCALNARGLGLVCSVQEDQQASSASEFVKFVGFGPEARCNWPLQWKVLQEPFLPCRVLQEWAASSLKARRARSLADAASAEAASASLVKMKTVNLRVQEAYLKRQVLLQSATRPSDVACTGLFVVGGAEPSAQSHAVQICNTEGGETGPAEYFGSFEYSADAPGTFSAFVWNLGVSCNTHIARLIRRNQEALNMYKPHRHPVAMV